MSKYTALWEYVSKQKENTLNLSFQVIQNILGTPIDHAFLSYKNELLKYGWKVKKIHLKKEEIEFTKMNQE